jgi:hypothetical protein
MHRAGSTAARLFVAECIAGLCQKADCWRDRGTERNEPGAPGDREVALYSNLRYERALKSGVS